VAQFGSGVGSTLIGVVAVAAGSWRVVGSGDGNGLCVEGSGVDGEAHPVATMSTTTSMTSIVLAVLRA
jgi:hypothetical protein